MYCTNDNTDFYLKQNGLWFCWYLMLLVWLLIDVHSNRYTLWCNGKTNFKNQNDLDETNVERYENINIVNHIRRFSHEQTTENFYMETGFGLKSRRTLYAVFVHKSRENYTIQKR